RKDRSHESTAPAVIQRSVDDRNVKQALNQVMQLEQGVRREVMRRSNGRNRGNYGNPAEDVSPGHTSTGFGRGLGRIGYGVEEARLIRNCGEYALHLPLEIENRRLHSDGQIASPDVFGAEHINQGAIPCSGDHEMEWHKDAGSTIDGCRLQHK